MNFFKKLFGSKTPSPKPPSKVDKPIYSYADFWAWFATQAPRFFQVVKTHGDFERDFFAHLSPKLNALREGYFMLTGMADDNTAELIITAEGQVKNFVFVEELIASAPQLSGWKFTALKPAIDMERFGVEMNGLKFTTETIQFCAQEDADFPDEIIINLVHQAHTPQNHDLVGHGCMIFIDNFLGELNAALMVDQFQILGKDETTQELIPIEKLLDYLKWRQAEFVEKYEAERRDTEHDSYSVLNGKLQSGFPLVATVNVDLLNWESKASHPWMLLVDIGYNCSTHQGLPDAETAEELAAIEDALLVALRDIDGYLNIGRQATQNERSIYFACREFRKPAKVLDAMIRNFEGSLTMKFDVFRDPYWRTVAHLMPRA